MRHEHITSNENAPQRHCPHDGQPLKLRQSAGVPVDVCPECDGVWLDPGEILLIAPDFPVEKLKPPLPAVFKAYPVPTCPGCHRGSLLPNLYQARGSRVELDACDHCGGVWIDMRQLRGVADGIHHVLESVPSEDPGRTRDEVTLPEKHPDRKPFVSFPTSPREWFVTITGMPLEVSNPCRIIPFATFALVLTCIAVFIVQFLSGPDQHQRLIEEYSLIPSRLQDGEYYRLFTATFLHAGVLHIGFNLFFLYTFGDNLEDRFGLIPYVILYFVAGLVGGYFSCLEGGELAADIPRIGASGAVSGLLGAYLVVFPRTRILMGIPFVRFFPLVFRWPVWTYLILWVVLNLLGWRDQSANGEYAVDYVAHIAGFCVGLVAGTFLGREPKRLRA